MVTKKVPDVPSTSLLAFLHQADATASEFLAQFSYSHYVDSATFQWTAHPSFRPRKPVADRPAASAPSVLANPPLDTPPAPTDAQLPYFRKIALLSEAELSCLLPGTDPSRLPRLQKLAALCFDAAATCHP